MDMRCNQLIVFFYFIFSFSAGSFAFVHHHHIPIHERRRRTSMATSAAADDDIVTIECLLKPEGTFVPEPLFDGIGSRETLSFVLHNGNYLPGLHDLISTMKVGESVKNQSLDAGWGAWNPNLKAKLEFEALAGSGLDTSLIKEGVELVMGNGMTAVVTEISEDKTSFTVDANPPLAGASYIAAVKLISKEQGPTEFLYSPEPISENKYEVATVALGCFWGGELLYMREPGVVGTKVGFTQGKTVDPTYEEVCAGSTGHTEAIQIIYDSTIVSFERLVDIGMERLGGSKYLLNQVEQDKGTQYRHGIYYHNDYQKKTAEKIVKSFGDDCVTEVLQAVKFYDAEDYHQQYLLKGGQSARKGDTSIIRCYG